MNLYYRLINFIRSPHLKTCQSIIISNRMLPYLPNELWFKIHDIVEDMHRKDCKNNMNKVILQINDAVDDYTFDNNFMVDTENFDNYFVNFFFEDWIILDWEKETLWSKVNVYSWKDEDTKHDYGGCPYNNPYSEDYFEHFEQL